MQTMTDKVGFERSAPVAILRGHREPLINLEILPVVSAGTEARSKEAGPLIFSASLDSTLRLWSVAEGTGECEAVLFAPGGQALSDARVMSGGRCAGERQGRGREEGREGGRVDRWVSEWVGG